MLIPRKPRDLTPRFGIGEWFGSRLTELSPSERLHYANEVLKSKKARQPQPCPFQSTKREAKCTKDGGVCSLRLYGYSPHSSTGRAVGVPISGSQGDLRATCPYRFHENLDVFRWIGKTLLNDEDPQLVGEVGFLEAGSTTDSDGGEDVGRIDMVLVSNGAVKGAPLEWCAVEIQAVYFSVRWITLQISRMQMSRGSSCGLPRGKEAREAAWCWMRSGTPHWNALSKV
jgi:hypothetical protein